MTFDLSKINKYKITIYDEKDNEIAIGYSNAYSGREAYWDVISELKKKDFYRQPGFTYSLRAIKENTFKPMECRIKLMIK